MSDVKCFLLRTEPKATHRAVIMTKRGLEAACGEYRHRAEIPIDADTTFADVRQNMLPVKCMYCGKFEFHLNNCEIGLNHSDTIYVNPETQKMSANIREVATPGALWFCPWFVEDGHVSSVLSEEYRRDWAGKRPPICVNLPGGSDWIVDQCAQGKTTGWRVTGVAPILTAHPSIVVPGYHGWLRNGVLISV